MTKSPPPYTPKRGLYLAYITSQVVFLIGLVGALTTVRAATNRAPILLSEATSTRAIAFEAVTTKAEPFPLTASVPFSPDTRTRIVIFAMNLELLAAYGPNAAEGTSAFTADARHRGQTLSA